MLTQYRRSSSAGVPGDLGQPPAPDAIWFDLLSPSPEEVAYVERATGLAMPSLEDLSEIEASSRLYVENGALFLSAPLVHRGDANRPETTPVGFVLTRELLVTVRFRPLVAFATFAQGLARPHHQLDGSSAGLARLLDAGVDRLADV